MRVRITEKQRRDRELVAPTADSFIMSLRDDACYRPGTLLVYRLDFILIKSRHFLKQSPATAFLAERPNGWLLMYRWMSEYV